MTLRISCIALLTLGLFLPAQAQGPDSSAAKAQKRLEELTAQQALERLQQTRKNLNQAIEQLQRPQATNPPPASTQTQAGVAVQSSAIQQTEQALLDVRRAIDELDVPQDRRQDVLDKLDDADSALRMARQPDADNERGRLQQALLDVQKEIEQAQQTLPEPAGAKAK